jgi:hypothetical protein
MRWACQASKTPIGGNGKPDDTKAVSLEDDRDFAGKR